MSKIHLTDNIQEAVIKVANGNPGAATVLVQALTLGDDIDPDDVMGGLGTVLSLDDYGIYGTDIWVFYKDICGGSIAKLIAVLRACQLGFFNSKVLIDACSRQDRSGVDLIPVEELYLKVKERLPRFHTNEEEAK